MDLGQAALSALFGLGGALAAEVVKERWKNLVSDVDADLTRIDELRDHLLDALSIDDLLDKDRRDELRKVNVLRRRLKDVLLRRGIDPESYPKVRTLLDDITRLIGEVEDGTPDIEALEDRVDAKVAAFRRALRSSVRAARLRQALRVG